MMILPVVIALTASIGSTQEPAMKLTASAPCSVFVTGEKLVFRRTGAGQPAMTCVVQGYDAKEVWRGEVTGAQLTPPELPPGYYELHWQAGDARGVASFGVVPARPDEPPPSGPLAVDGATAWLSAPEQWEPIAKMLRRVGIGWMRERLSWGQVNPADGKVDWDKYQTVADALHAQGVREYQIFHDSPGWTHPGKDTRCPDDLREVYRFTKEAGAHFAGEILAWEPWNEPDISFFDQLGDKYAGIQKAAFLGVRAGNPEARVLSCSFCRGRSGFSDNVFESGIADYMDVFNFHTYTPIAQYVDSLERWVALADTYGVGDRPIWLTEAGIRLPHVERELTPENERLQAEFVPRSFAISLASGITRHFFFVLPFYPEGSVQFGAMHKDASPRPALLAIATAVRLLGEGKYLGKLKAEPEAVQAYAFDSGAGPVAVVWAAEPTDAKLPTAARSVQVTDVVGRERQVQTDGGTLALPVGPSAQYVVGLGNVAANVTGVVRPAPKLPKLDPSKVVLVGYLDSGTLDKDSNCHVLPGNQPASFVVDAYNFDETQGTKGRVTLRLPPGWKAEQTEAEVSLDPMGRQTLRFAVTPGLGKSVEAGSAKVRVEGTFPGPAVAPSVSYARLDPSTLEPTKRLDLNLNRPEAWRPNTCGCGKMSVQPGPDGSVSFPITFTGDCDRWAYPRAAFDGAQDWRDYQAIAFEYRFDTDDDSTTARIQVIETSGSSYLPGAEPATKEWRRVVAPFSTMGWGSFSAADPDGKLDLDRIGSILVGCNTKRLDKLTLEVRNVELLAFD
jgi:hypothetical protein